MNLATSDIGGESSGTLDQVDLRSSSRDAFSEPTGHEGRRSRARFDGRERRSRSANARYVRSGASINVDSNDDKNEDEGCSCFLFLVFLLGIITMPISLVVAICISFLPCVPISWRNNDFFVAFSYGARAGLLFTVFAIIVIKGVEAYRGG